MNVERKNHDVWVTVDGLNVPLKITPHLARTVAKGLKDVVREGGNKRWSWGKYRLAISVTGNRAVISFHDSIYYEYSLDDVRGLIAVLNAHSLGVKA